MSKGMPLTILILTCFAGAVSAQNIVDMVDPSFLANASSKTLHAQPHDLTNGKAHSRHGIFGIDSIPNFNDQFFADGFDFNGNPNRHWYTNTVGNPPRWGAPRRSTLPFNPSTSNWMMRTGI